jgi:hypothetical protein
MSDHERGAYTPPTDAPLSFDARQPVRGSRPLPFTLIISILVLAGLAVAIFIFYRSGVRQAGQPPQAVGVPVGGMKAAPPAEAQPQDPAAGLQIYKTEGGKSADGAISPQFTAPPEQPQARPQAAAPTVVVTPAAPATPAQPAPTLRPSIPSAPPAAATPAAPPKPEPAPTKLPPPAPKAEAAAPKPAPVVKAAPPPVAKPAPAKPEAKAAALAPAPAAKAPAGVAAVQIGAFSSQALADKGWSDAAAIAPGASAGKGKFVEKVDKDGKTLFRTQVTGFASRADAVAFCDKLKAAGKACFVK